MARSSSLVIGLAILLALVQPAFTQVVTIGQGTLNGVRRGDVELFNNIPFTAPPIGPLRWKPPVAAGAWTGTRDATVYGPACSQGAPPSGAAAANPLMGEPAPVTMSEDCLNLNVARPAATKLDARLPVMVWFFGGGFQNGSNAQKRYLSAALISKGVILVVPNYRLGPFGFFAHPELTLEDPNHSSGDYGALDAIEALKWVKLNIAAFGGDPDNVTIFGHSSGGALVGLLSGSPLARGLFQRGISQSGSFFGPPQRGLDPGGGDTLLGTAEQWGVEMFKRMGVATLAEARRLAPEKILEAYAAKPGQQWIVFRPVIDGWFLPKPTYELLAAGEYHTPTIVGTTDDDGQLFVPFATLEQYRQLLAAFTPFEQQLQRLYPASTDAEALHAARDIWRDATFAWPAWAWAINQRGTGAGPVYLYNFKHRPPFPQEPRFSTFRAPHGAELPYMFGDLKLERMAWGADDQALSMTMIDYWTNFAKTGDPNGAGLNHWPAFTGDKQQSMHFGRSDWRAEEVANLDRLKLFDRIFAARRARQH